jgi:hypothetical protein
MPDSGAGRPRFCSHCGQRLIVPDAAYCKECGAALPIRLSRDAETRFDPLVALALSIVPGVGHWYNGRPGRGVLWFILVIFFYAVFPEPLPALIHLICAANAAASSWVRGEKIINRKAPRAL